MSRQLVSIQDAAEYLDITVMTVRRLISRGELAAYRVGNSKVIRVDMAQINAELLRPIPTASKP